MFRNTYIDSNLNCLQLKANYDKMLEKYREKSKNILELKNKNTILMEEIEKLKKENEQLKTIITQCNKDCISYFLN